MKIIEQLRHLSFLSFKIFLYCLSAGATFTLPSLVLAQATQAPTLVAELRSGIHLIKAEVAQTSRERERGLMFREKLAPNHGMIFVFPEKGVQCFWMRNTLIPLTIAFLDDGGEIINLADMQPRSEDSHCSKKPVRYALEMQQGWFKQRGIQPGMKIEGIENKKGS